MDRQYYLNNGREQTGPFSLDAIRQLRPQGITHVWYAGLPDWLPLDQVPEVKEALRAQAPPSFATVPPVPGPQAPVAAPVATGAAPAQATWTPASGPVIKDPHVLADEIDRLYNSTVTYFVLFIVSLAIMIALMIVFFSSNEIGAGILVSIVGSLAVVAFAVLFTVCWCKLHYRNWAVAIRHTGFQDHTAGMAVGFLFIPLFNLYWIFPSYQKLGELLNKVMAQDKYEGRGPKVNSGTVTAMCVLSIVAIIPYLGWFLVNLVNIFLWFNVHNMNRKATTFILRSGL